MHDYVNYKPVYHFYHLKSYYLWKTTNFCSKSYNFEPKNEIYT